MNNRPQIDWNLITTTGIKVLSKLGSNLNKIAKIESNIDPYSINFITIENLSQKPSNNLKI